MTLARIGCLLTFPALIACGSSEDSNGNPEPQDGCTRGELEPDIVYVPMTLPGGPLVDPPSEGYIVSSTYLRLRHDEAVLGRFRDFNRTIQADLLGRPGLLGLEFAVAVDCNTARTKSVWASVEAMYEFVAGEAHGAAVQAIDELSRGGSVVTHWTAKSLDHTTWDEAAVRLQGDKGPVY